MIAVVGGGISGLALGYFLDRDGAPVTIFEAGPRPGGLIATIERDGRVLELGPQRVRLTPPVARLVAELGLDRELVTAPDLPLFIYADGRLRTVPFDLGDFFATDLVGWRDRLRLLAEPLTPRLRPEETAASFFIRKLGRRTYRRVVAPLFGGLYASDPADMPARYALAPMLAAAGADRSLLPALVRGLRNGGRPPASSFRGGLRTLTDALADRLGDALRLDAPVREIRRDGAGFRIIAGDDEVRADRVVLACPADAAGRALEALAPGAADRLRRLHYNPLATVHLRSDAAISAMGWQPTLEPRHATHGVTCNHALFGRDGVYTAFLGGAKRPEVPALDDAALGALAVEDFREMAGADADVLHVHRTAMPAWDGTWAALDGLTLPAGITACANWFARAGIMGRIVDARTVADRLYSPRFRQTAPPLAQRQAR